VTYKNQHKTLLILDIDETLIHARKDALEHKADFMIADYYVYTRPFLTAFLTALQKDFILAAWSSASDDYVQAVLQQIIPQDIQLEFAWGRSRCTYKRNTQMDEHHFSRHYDNNHYHYTKPLTKVKRKGYCLERILIVDDSPHKLQDNYGNAIYPKAFEGNPNDDELHYLLQYLQTLKDKTNVRNIEKRNWRAKLRK